MPGPEWDKAAALGDYASVNLAMTLVIGLGRRVVRVFDGRKLRQQLSDRRGLEFTGVGRKKAEEIARIAEQGDIAGAAERLKETVEALPVEQRRMQAREVQEQVLQEQQQGGEGTARPGDAADGGASVSSPAGDAGAVESSATVPLPRGAMASDAEVHAAAMAPDARQRLGDVRAGSLHALEAYRFLYPKLEKMGRLSPEEQVKLQSATEALGAAEGIQKQMPVSASASGSAGGGGTGLPGQRTNGPPGEINKPLEQGDLFGNSQDHGQEGN